jgi:6-phosphogluconolactonase
VSTSQEIEFVYAAAGRSLRVATLDPATGVLDTVGVVDGLRGDIQYGAMHPSHRYLYVSATDRAATNLIYAFDVDARTGMLSHLGEPFVLPASLSRAVHITVDNTGHYLLMAHNVTESAAALTLGRDGRVGGLVSQPAMPKLGFLVHQIRVDSTNTLAFVPVRGNDAQPTVPEQNGRLHLLSFNDGVLCPQQTIEYETGIGPRHLDFHPTSPWLYVAAERGNVLITYRRDASGLTELFRTTTLKDTSLRFPAQRAGAIHIHPNGKWLYVTNRDVDAAGENNIAFFSVDPSTGKPTLIEHADSHGFEPRTFTFDRSGAFLIAANMMNIARKDENGIVDIKPNLSIFRIGADGRLAFVRSEDGGGGAQLWWVGT